MTDHMTNVSPKPTPFQVAIWGMVISMVVSIDIAI
jgi:hypothetical protein